MPVDKNVFQIGNIVYFNTSAMSHTNFLLIFAFLYMNNNFVGCLTSSRLPKLLMPCYDGNFSMENKPPLTITTLIELLRKIELNDKTNINQRILTSTLLHKIILDGVLKSTRATRDSQAVFYRARGHEFHKYKLVTDYIVTGESTLSVNESLSQSEICFLHYMLSTSIDNSYRGDEEKTCAYIFSNKPVEFEMQNLKLSICPLMKGNIHTKWGTLTPGHLVYALSAALENSRFSFDTVLKEINKSKTSFGKDEVNTMWVSTIAGDLAETLLIQADNDPEIGITGFWNDSVLPVNYYLSKYSSYLTQSILLGGIDGLILGYKMKSWKQLLMTTRFSQIIDMYYSKRGIAYDNKIKASNRKTIFADIVKSTNLTHQVIGAATLLKEIANYDIYLSSSDIKELATLSVDRFEEKLDEITTSYDSFDYVDEIQPKNPLEIIIILDGSYDYTNSKKIV